MDNPDRLKLGLKEAIDALKGMQGKEVIQSLVETGLLGSFITAIAPPNFAGRNPYDVLLEEKYRFAVIASLHRAIRNHYAIRVVLDNGKPAFISPYPDQWFKEAVLLLQGTEPFTGGLGKYDNSKELSFAVMKRDIGPGDPIIPEEDFVFVDYVEAEKRIKTYSKENPAYALEQSILELEGLLEEGVEDESRYQAFFERHPWILMGGMYNSIDSHRHFNDENIPDFTAQRARDGYRDILEIKQPFLSLFKKNGDFASAFNDTWNQGERYLTFSQTHRQYLAEEKFMKILNPDCYIIAGHNLSNEQRKKISDKHKHYPGITVLTYNEIIAIARNMLRLFREIAGGKTAPIIGASSEDNGFYEE